MSTFDISQMGSKRVAGLKGFSPDQAGFETRHPVVIIMDFNHLQIMPIFASGTAMLTVFAEDFQ